MQTDAELVKAVLNGEKRAFAELVRRYERPVRAVALNIVGDYHFAADVSQDAFVRAFEKLAGLRSAEAFGPWLMKITQRCALDLVHKRPKEASLEAAAVRTMDNPDGQLNEDKQRILAAVMKLPGAEKQVIMLRYFSGHGVRDVADIVGRSVGTVTKQLSRARRRLQKVLKESEL